MSSSPVDAPFELPDGWAWCRLMDLCRSISDGDHQAPPQEPSGIPFLVISNVSNGTLDFSGTRFVGEDYFKSLMPSRIPSNGDILVTVTGSYGIVVRVDTNRPFCFQRHIALLKCYKAESGYLFYALQSNNVKRYFDAVATGTAQKTVALNHLRATPIPFPPFSEQKRIVARIEELFKIADSLGEAADGLAEAAKRLDRKILDLAIRGKLVPQNPNDEPASELLKRIAAASHKSPFKNQDAPIDPPFVIPQSWEWVRLGDLFQHNTGKALNRNGQTGVMHRYITTSNVYWDEFKLDDLRQMPFTEEELEKCSVKKGDLLVCEGGDIGRAAIWNFNQSICIQNHLHRLRPFVKVYVPFFCFVLRLYKATNRLQGRGIGLQGFSSRMLHNLPVPLPPLAEQKRIVAKIEELRAVIKPLTM